jgi:putative glycosyltransferase (TIGR04372 family)
MKKLQLFGNKLSLRILHLIHVVLAAPLVLLIVFIRPFIWLRFGIIRSERIGHFSSDVEAFICSYDVNNLEHRTFDIISCPDPVSNRQLKKMWERTLRITSGAWFWKILDRSCRFWTRSDAHHLKLSGRYDDFRLFLTNEPHISFTSEEDQMGRVLLEKVGIPVGASWICIHNRDSSYLNTAIKGDWAYHNFRDFSIQSMLEASDELSKRGYYVVRMGAIVNEQLITNNTKIIDYASSTLRSDFMDIYLLGNCLAYIGSDAGIACVPLIFRKPIVYVNHSLTLLDILVTEIIYPFPFITKHLWHNENQRLISLREMFEAGLYGVAESYKFEEAGVEVIANTPEEIRDLVIEVDELLKDTWQPQPQAEDEELQQRFWSIFQQYAQLEHIGNIQARIGTKFLRDNTYLLN